MKGDFSRVTFRPDRHYRRVYLQQGRAQLDADFNEQTDIEHHLIASLGQDVVGSCGATGGGFAVQTTGPRELTIQPGRMYVDGIQCCLESATSFAQQADAPGAALPTGNPADTTRVPYLVYLDVWERHITALEDPNLRELALQGADTCTRTQVVQQVKLCKLSADVATALPADWSAQPEWSALVQPSTGKLTVTLDPSGYVGSDNQLYRVEIHQVQGADIYYKWSRDNGAICTRVILSADRQVSLQTPPRDDYAAFAGGQWVELLDDAAELQGRPGKLVLLTAINNLDITFDPSTDPLAAVAAAPNWQVGQSLTMRRWDGIGKAAAGTAYRLENGLNIQLSSVLLRTADYWLIPARRDSRDISWPRDSNKPFAPLAIAPHGIRHHYARLAKVYLSQNQLSATVDLRLMFISNTDVMNELSDIKRRLALLESKVK